jgi:endonuclease/exonuclease/phosphatase (EEP) superfamily protein YafD
MRQQQRVAAILAIGYVLIFLVWRVLEASPLASMWWPLQVSEIFAVWALLPLPFLLALPLLWRTKWVWLALFIPVIWFGREYGGQFVPPTFSVARTHASGASLRLMTFNTHALFLREEEFVEAVEEWQLDIFALQEVNHFSFAGISELAKDWPYHQSVTVRLTGRVAIFSKWPILSIENDNEVDGCHCAQALVDWNGKTLRVIVVHIRAPKFGSNVRSRVLALSQFDLSHQTTSFESLSTLINESKEPVIVLGDFNTTDRQPGYRILYETGLKDAHEEAGWGFGMTYPAPFRRFWWLPISLIRIDHIFYDEAWQAVWTRTRPFMDSDHLALLAELEWVGSE